MYQISVQSVFLGKIVYRNLVQIIRKVSEAHMKCKIIGCNGQHHSKGLCQKHYRQLQRGALKEPTTESLLESLKSYEDIISSGVKHNNQRLASFFTLVEMLVNDDSSNNKS